MDPERVQGVGLFGLAALTWAYFPHVALHFGTWLTTMGLTGFTLGGMFKLGESRQVIESIEIIKSGADAGKLKINVSMRLFIRSSIIADVNSIQGMVPMTVDDVGEKDSEANLVVIQNYLNTATGQQEERGYFVLPADAHRDHNMLDYIMSNKNGNSPDDSTADSFRDLMLEDFNTKAKSGGLNRIAQQLVQSGYDKPGSDGAIDIMIDRDHKSVDTNLQKMKKHYGDADLNNMTPQEFYQNYKKIASGITV